MTVRDDGPGIPTDLMPSRARSDQELSILEAICTRLHGWTARDGGYPHVYIAPSLHGVGLAAVNALCDQLSVETTYAGARWSIAFERGERVARLRRIGATSCEGTTVRFRADATIFSSTALDAARVRARLEQLGWLYPHLRIWFQEQRVRGRGGLAGLARTLAAERGDIVQTFSLAQSIGNIRLELACAWNRIGPAIIRSFVNTHATQAGSHHLGLWLGFADYARSAGSPATRVEHMREAIGCGLVAVMHVTLAEPRFAGCTRDELRQPQVAQAIRGSIARTLAPDGWRLHHTRRFLDERVLARRSFVARS